MAAAISGGMWGGILDSDLSGSYLLLPPRSSLPYTLLDLLDCDDCEPTPNLSLPDCPDPLNELYIFKFIIRVFLMWQSMMIRTSIFQR